MSANAPRWRSASLAEWTTLCLSRDQRELVLALRMHAAPGAYAKGNAGLDALTLSLKDRAHLIGGKLRVDLTADDKLSITARIPLERDTLTHAPTAREPQRPATRSVSSRSPKERAR